MGPLKGPRALLLIAALTFCTLWILCARSQTELPAATKCTDERTGQAELSLALHARRQLRWDYGNISLDDIGQRRALMALYSATNGLGWKTANVSSIGAMPWGTEGVSYCRWYGVTCCASSPLSQVDCSGLHSVVILSLDGFGLAGYVPAALGSLPELTVLGLANNPKLGGTLPQSLSSLPHLLWLSVEDTGIVACMEASGGPARGALPAPVKGPCSLSPGLEFTDRSYYPFGVNEYLCPAVVLSSFLSYTSNLSPDMWDLVTLPFPAPSTPGAVIGGGSFTFYYNCACRDARHTFEVQDNSGYASAVCVGPNEWQRRRTGIIVAFVFLPVTLLLVAGCVYICAVHKATLNRLVRRKEAEMARKRSKVPGTPARVLQNGRGVLELSDVIVTWVVTDVAASTQLWEWKPDVMDRAIDLHNAAMRALMDEFGGHEIRNEGDSFTLSFHDAVDAVTFCLKAQEKLMNVDWPKELAEHPRTGAVTVGDVTCNPEAAGKGPPLMNGLRVRMGVNTGVPDDIFLHDMTDHVDYRGLAYDLAGEICDLAEGGQVLLGPQTIRRWNKVNYTALNDNLIADLLREQHGGSFLQPSAMHGASGRRGSITGFGGAPGSGLLLGLGRESQQLQAHYSSNAGTATGMALFGATGYGMSALPVVRPHSDSQPQPPGQNPSETEEAGDDDLSAAGAPHNWSLKLLTLRSMRMHRNSSPTWQMRMGAPAFRNMTRSSDGALTAAGGAGGAISPGQGMKLALNHGPPPRQSSRSKVGSPHANTFSKTSQTEGTQRGRLSTASGMAGGGSAAASGGEESDGRQGARPFKRVNSTDGLLRLHAARAAELAAAAQAAAAATVAGNTDGLPVVAFGTSNSRGSNGRGSNGHGSNGRGSNGRGSNGRGSNGRGSNGRGSNGRRPSQVDDSDDDRSSPRPLSPARHASGHLSMLGLRIAAAQASTGSGADGHNSAGGRRRGDDTEASGKSVVSAPVSVGPVLQRWLSQGWRNLALPSLPRSQTAGPGSLASAVAAAAGSGQLQVSGGLPAAPRTSMSLGSRVMWTRMNGGAAVTGRARAAATSNGGTLDGTAALPVDDDSPLSGTPVGSARVLDRVSSHPINPTSMSRLAAPPRRSEPTSKESYLRQQPGTFLSLTYHSREDSREIKPEGSQNSSAHARPDSLSLAQRPFASDAHPTSLGPSPGSADQYAMLSKAPSCRAVGHTAASAPLSMLMPTGHTLNNIGPSLVDVSRLTGTSSRRMPLGMPGPPRMSLASEPGLHPLLLNPMQPGGLAVVQMPGRLSFLRHPQQLGPRTAGPSPLRALQHMTGEQGNGTTLVTGHDPSFRAGESLTNATGSASRRTPSGPNNRYPIDLRAGSVDGGGGTRGDSGSPLRPHSVGQQPYAQLSYQQYGTQGGYYAFESPAVDPISGAVGYEHLHMRDLLPRLWGRLLSALLLLFHRCLRCVRLLTSSDDDPADVGMWGATDGTVLGGAVGGSRAATGASKTQQIKGVLVDMGYYQFLTVDYQGQAPAAHKVHLMQIVPDSVAPRVLMFPWPLSLPPGWEKISPGFFDAPGSSRLLYPAMRELLAGDLQAQRPVVTVAFASIEGFKDLSAVSVDLARDVLQLHSAAVRETLSTCSGYECKEFNGSFMTTFTAPTSAVEWALTLQLALVALPWPDELLTCEAAAVVLNSEDDMVLFRGLRCRVGIYAGPIDRVTPHPKTGRADYFGQPVNRAARLMTAAQGGQVVLDQSLLDEVLEEWRRRQEVRRLATIPSVDETTAIDDFGSLAGGPSEMRTARSFVSARSIGRLTKQQNMLVGGGVSGAIVGNPSATIVTELSLQQPNSKGDGYGTPATTPTMTALSTDQLCNVSPFNSQGGSTVAKAIASIGAFRDGGTDGSSSPHISAACAASPTGSNGALAAGGGGHSSEGPMASHVDVPVRHERISSSNAASMARSLDRILTDQRVQRSARSEPRIQRVTRFGLGGLTTMLRGGGSGGHTHGGNASVDASEIIRSNCGGSSVAVPRSPLAQPPDTSSKSLQVTVSSQAPWFTESGSVSVAAAMAAIQGRSRSFLHRTGGGGSGAGARSSRCLSQATAPVGGSITSGSFGSAVAAGGGTSMQSTAQLVSWGANTRAHSHGSPAGSMQSSTAGAAGSEQPSTLRLAPGLELQPVAWDPAARSTSAAVAARIRRGRRASVGGIVENMLLGARRLNSGMVQGSPGSHLASSVSASARSGQMSGLATPKTTRVSPATAAARARLLSDSPQTQLGSISGRRTGSVSIPATVVMLQAIGGVSNRAQTAPTYPSALDLPDSPSTTAALPGARSPASHYRSGACVRRTGSSPLGPMAAVVQQTETVNGAWQSHADNSAHRKPSPDGSSASGYNNGSMTGFHTSAPSVATQLAGTWAGPYPNAQHHQNLRSLQQQRPVSVSEPRLHRQASAGTPSTPPSVPFENAQGQPVMPVHPVSADGNTQLLRDSLLSQTDAGESRPSALQLATQAGHAAQTSGPKSTAVAAPGVPETAPTGQVLTGRHGVPGGKDVLPSLAEGRAPSWDYANDANAGSSGPLYLLETHPFRSGPEEWSSGVRLVASPGASTAQADGGTTLYSVTQVLGTKEIFIGDTAAGVVVTPAGALPAGRLARSDSQAIAQATVHGGRVMNSSGSKEGKGADGEESSQRLRRSSDEPGSDRNASTQASPCLTCSDGSGSGDGMGVPLTIRMLPTVAPASTSSRSSVGPSSVRPMFLGSGAASSVRQPLSERSSPQPGNNPRSPSIPSTASSTRKRLMFERTSSAAMSGVLADSDIMPSFAVNLVSRPSVGQVAAPAASTGDIEAALALDGTSAHSPASPSMCGRSFASVYVNPMYTNSKKSVLSEGTIVEEDGSEAGAQSLDPFGMRASLPRPVSLRGDPPSQLSSSPTSLTLLPQRSVPQRFSPSFPPRLLSMPSGLGVNDGGPNGMRMLGLPPAIVPFAPSIPVAAAAASRRRSLDGPRHPVLSGSPCSAAQGTVASGSGSLRVFGRHHLSRNSSGIAASLPITADSPAVSDVYCTTREVVNDSPASLHTSQPAAVPMLARHMTGGRVTSAPLYGGTVPRGSLALSVGSLDAAVFGGGGGSHGPTASAGLTAASQFIPESSPAIFRDAAGGGIPPQAFITSAANRRRASSGTIMGVSLRDAAEAAIQQLQQQHHPLTPPRFLRKSTSSRGRRHVAEARGPTGMSSSLDPGILSVAANIAGTSGGTMGHRVPLRPHSLRPSRAGIEAVPSFLPLDRLSALVSPRAHRSPHMYQPFERAGDSSQRSEGVGSLARLPGSDNGGGSRNVAISAALRRSAPGHTPSFVTAGACGSVSSSSVSGNTSQAQVVLEPARPGQRLPGTSIAPCATAGKGPGKSVAAAASRAAPSSMPNAGCVELVSMPGAGFPSTVDSCSAGGLLGMWRRSSAGSQHAHASAASPYRSSPQHQQHLLHQQHAQHLNHPTGNLSTSSAVYSRHGTNDSLANSPRQTLTRGSTTLASCVLSRAGHRTSHTLIASAAIGAAPGIPRSAPQPISPGTRNTQPSNTAMLSLASQPGAAPVSGPSGSTEAPALLLPSPAAGTTTTGPGQLVVSPGMAAYKAVPVRASNQSQQDDVLSNTTQSMAREFSQPSDPAAAMMHSTTGIRGSRKRAPRGATSGGEEAAGSGGPTGGGANNPVQEKVPAAQAAALDAATGSAAGGGAASLLPGGKSEKESRPAVMAECYKITQQPAGGVGAGGGEVAQSITMIKYTNLKQELERAEEGEGDDVPVPTTTLLVPTVAVEVAIWSLGSFRLKGVTEPIKIVQVLPTELEGRLAFFNKAGLNRGKARCIERRVACLNIITLQLPDVSKLSCVNMGAVATPARVGGSGDGTGGALGYEAGEAGQPQLPLPDGGDGGGYPPWTTALDPGESVRPGAGQGVYGLQHGSYSQAGVGPSGGMYGVARGGGVAVPIVLGQITSPADAALRWGGHRGMQMPIRELESSEAGLPPISEVITPVSSPIVRSPDALPVLLGAPSHFGAMQVHRRTLISQPSAPLPYAPTSPSRSSAALQSRSSMPFMSRPPPASTSDVSSGSASGPGGRVSSQQAHITDTTALSGGSSHGSQPSRYTSIAPYETSLTGSGTNAQHQTSHLHSLAPHHLPLSGNGALWNNRTPSGGLAMVYPPSHVAETSMSLITMRPRQQSSQGDRHSSQPRDSVGEVAITARLSTGLLPLSLSYMAPRGRDTRSSIAAMMDAGMDVRSPGESPATTVAVCLTESDAEALQILGHGSALADADPAADAGGGAWGLHVHVDGLQEAVQMRYNNAYSPSSAVSTPETSAAAGGAVASTPATAVATATAMFSQDRTSAGTGTRPHSALVIDRSSSGFNHAPSSGLTPVHPWTDRSSSGRYGSSQVPPYTLIGTDRTSQRSSAQDWSSSTRLTHNSLPPCFEQGLLQLQGSTGRRAGVAVGAAAYVRFPSRGLSPHDCGTPASAVAETRQSQQGHGGNADEGGEGGPLPMTGRSVSHELDWQQAPSPSTIQHHPRHSQPQVLVLGSDGHSDACQEFGPEPVDSPTSTEAHRDNVVGRYGRDVGRNEIYRSSLRERHSMEHPGLFNKASGGAIGSSDGGRGDAQGSLASSPDAGASIAARISQVPRTTASFAILEATAGSSGLGGVIATQSNGGAGLGLESATNVYDITVSIRSSIAGSATAGHHSHGGGGGGVLSGLDSLRAFGLVSQLPSGSLVEPVSASDLLQPFMADAASNRSVRDGGETGRRSSREGVVSGR